MFRAINFDKFTDAQKVYMCKKNFKMGWLLIPVLWIRNIVWFYRDAFLRDDFPGQHNMQKYLIYSASGALLSTVFLIHALIINGVAIHEAFCKKQRFADLVTIGCTICLVSVGLWYFQKIIQKGYDHMIANLQNPHQQ